MQSGSVQQLAFSTNVGFVARTNALMNLPSTASGFEIQARALQERRGIVGAIDPRGLDVDLPRIPRRRAALRYSCSSSAPATHPIQSSMLRAHVSRHLAAHDDIGDREAATGLEDAECLGEAPDPCRPPEVDHAVRDDHVDAVVGQRDVLDLALEELDVGQRPTGAGSRAPARASRRSCRGRRPCRSARRAWPKAERRCHRPSPDRAPSRLRAARPARSGCRSRAKPAGLSRGCRRSGPRHTNWR